MPWARSSGKVIFWGGACPMIALISSVVKPLVVRSEMMSQERQFQGALSRQN
jgi:hypothetical protein